MRTNITPFPEKESKENPSENGNFEFDPVQNTINLGKFYV